jgi:prepilin peptidase CpaA
MHVLSTVINASALGLLAWLAVTDVRYRRLPNRAVFLVGALYFLDAGISGQTSHQIVDHCTAGLIAFAAGVLLYAVRAFAAGDAKLAAIVFLWCGLDLSVPTLMLISISGMAVGLLSYATRRIESADATGWKKVLANFSDARGVPYGVALAIGGGMAIARFALYR